MASRQEHLRTQLEELQKKYATLSKGIAAKDTDIGRALDTWTKQVREEERAELEGERSQIAVEIDQLLTNISRDPGTEQRQVREPRYADIGNERDDVAAKVGQVDSRVTSSSAATSKRASLESGDEDASVVRAALQGRGEYINWKFTAGRAHDVMPNYLQETLWDLKRWAEHRELQRSEIKRMRTIEDQIYVAMTLYEEPSNRGEYFATLRKIADLLKRI